ncbi:efflux transporter, RND family, MFP subunit [Opitutus terrae PB90-1]|uniref:Efflux transporter, RND family, MFP subunit n=1 Tax=Opitutus terrae (strain DSM 11246 / JCM 15787 / PB90-1) TaxID=452637 RepID=B1ZQD2_OPITP|nr:efflux transporter, RND family, MFP subunit [Opitutus terrae PB90-1]
MLVIAGVAIAAGLGAHAWWPRTAAADATVETVHVSRRDVGTVVKATGVIKPRVGAEVRVGSRTSGVVNRLHVRVGDAVKPGELLAEIDDRDLAARREQSAAELQRALAELRFAESEWQRRRELGRSGVITASELDLAERAAVVAAQQVAVARANLTYATTQLDYARITAPIGGVVASVATQEGETVAASFSAPTFVTLIDLTRLEVWAYVDETDIGRIELGQPARFTVDTYGEEEFEGVVTAIYPKAEIRDNVVNYITVVRFEQPRDRVLRPEMTTTVRIAIELHAAVPSLPAGAVRSENGRAYVLVREGGAVARRWISVGARDPAAWEITSGLRDGDEVLVGDIPLKGEPGS